MSVWAWCSSVPDHRYDLVRHTSKYTADVDKVRTGISNRMGYKEAFESPVHTSYLAGILDRRATRVSRVFKYNGIEDAHTVFLTRPNGVFDAVKRSDGGVRTEALLMALVQRHTFDENTKVALRSTRAQRSVCQRDVCAGDYSVLTISSSAFCLMILMLAVFEKKPSTKEILPTVSASRSWRLRQQTQCEQTCLAWNPKRL